MNDVDNELKSCVASFVEELTSLIRRQALEAVEEVLNDGAGLKGRRAIVRSGPAGRDLIVPTRHPGEKRTSEELRQTIDKVYGYIKSNSGQGIEQIARALNTTTKDLTLPIHKLVAGKKVGSKGEKRATRYFAR